MLSRRSGCALDCREKKKQIREKTEVEGGTLLFPFLFSLLQLSISPEAGTGPFVGLHSLHHAREALNPFPCRSGQSTNLFSHQTWTRKYRHVGGGGIQK